MSQPTAALAQDFDVRAYLDTSVGAIADPTPIPTVAFFAALRQKPGSTWADQAGAWQHAEGLFGQAIFGPALFHTANDAVFRYPHGIPWTAFPVLSDPHYKDDPNLPQAQRVFERDGETFPVLLEPEVAYSRLSDIYIVLRDDPWGTTAVCYQAHRALVTLHRRPVPASATVHIADEAGVRSLPLAAGLEALRLAARNVLAWRRFEYSYTVNFTAIAGRAYEIATARMGARRTFSDLRGRHDLCDHKALQALFAIRRAGMRDEPGAQPPLNGIGGLHLVDGRMQWLGTGKYPPASAWYFQEGLDRLLSALQDSGLVTLDPRTMRATMTELGLHFLDLMHPDNEDPDALCRWEDPGQDHGPSLDAWINRQFRKMKTVVNTAA